MSREEDLAKLDEALAKLDALKRELNDAVLDWLNRLEPAERRRALALLPETVAPAFRITAGDPPKAPPD